MPSNYCRVPGCKFLKTGEATETCRGHAHDEDYCLCGPCRAERAPAGVRVALVDIGERHHLVGVSLPAEPWWL